MEQPRKLYWLEYTDAGPLIIRTPFEAVGFEVQANGWGPTDPERLGKVIFPKLEDYRPDLIILWMSRGYYKHFTQEPTEWVTTCRRIREHPKLQHTKFMVFLAVKGITPEKEAIWSKRYDFYTHGPVRCIEHARAAKRLIGEEIKGFEGVNYHLRHNGNWKIQDYFLNTKLSKDEVQPDAVGQFAQKPDTRLLATNTQDGYIWIADSIQSRAPTYIVYIIKSSKAWKEGLSKSEFERLRLLTEKNPSSHQFLIGANDTLLQAGGETVVQVLEQAQKAGGWQVFINEHLWFEGLRVGSVKYLYDQKSEIESDEKLLVVTF